jgi:hypothetical protein
MSVLSNTGGALCPAHHAGSTCGIYTQITKANSILRAPKAAVSGNTSQSSVGGSPALISM